MAHFLGLGRVNRRNYSLRMHTNRCYHPVWMRTVSSSLLAVLVLAALFWGNCLSCPQMLLSMGAGVPAHGCCQHGKTPVSSRDNCQSFGLKHFVKAGPAMQAPARTVQSLPMAATAPAMHVYAAECATFVEFFYSPPDREILNSTFRI